MLLGFISLLLTATSSTIANFCIPSRFYDSTFAPCTRSEIDAETEDNSSKERKLLMASVFPHPFRRVLNGVDRNTCKEACALSIKKIIVLHSFSYQPLFIGKKKNLINQFLGRILFTVALKFAIFFFFFSWRISVCDILC